MTFATDGAGGLGIAIRRTPATVEAAACGSAAHIQTPVATDQGRRLFPRCAAACDHLAHIDLRDAAGRQEGISHAAAMYAEELLPIILGGAWRLSQSCAFPPGGCVLIDHQYVYRRAGTRGRLTWRDAAVLGMPYHTLDDTGAPTKEALATAGGLAEIGVGIWARRDLSAHYPHWTRLVIAAPGLLGRDPAAFGFRTVAEF